MSFIHANPKIGAVIRGKSPASCMSYHEDGTHLFVTSEADSRLRVIDCQRGVSDKPAVRFDRDGIRLVEATHHVQSILFTGAGKDKTQNVGQRNAVIYLSLHDNKILREFRGHSGYINDIHMNPVDDTFLTSSADRTVRLWDLQKAGSLASMEMPKSGKGTTMDPTGCPLAAFDCTGLVFAIAAPIDANAGYLIHQYDARNYGGGAFAEMKVDHNSLLNSIQSKVSDSSLASELSRSKWKTLRFNKSGKEILIKTESGLVIIVDGYEGTITNVFFSESADGSPRKHPAGACFTADGDAVLIGNEDGSISCWDAVNGSLMKKLEGHVGTVMNVESNPKYAQIASSCTNIALWNM